MLAAATAEASAIRSLDGIDLLLVLKGGSPVRDRTVFWRIYNRDALRQGKWKFLRDGEVRRLFDLSLDQRAQAVFSKKFPDVLQRLMSEFDKWNEQMLPRLRAN